MTPCFWMVLRDNSVHTAHRHPTLESARSEATRLATQNPGVKFFVLQSIGSAELARPITWDEHDIIPF